MEFLYGQGFCNLDGCNVEFFSQLFLYFFTVNFRGWFNFGTLRKKINRKGRKGLCKGRKDLQFSDYYFLERLVDLPIHFYR